MLLRILSTIGSRLFAGFVLLIILGLHSKYLGVIILGQLAIFRFGASINHLFASVFSGPAIVYLGNRVPVSRLFLPSLLWVILCVSILSMLQFYFEVVSYKYLIHLILFSFLLSTQSFLEQILLSDQRIYKYNISAYIYHAVLLLSTSLLIFNFKMRDENVFFISTYISLSVTLFYLLIVTLDQFNTRELKFDFNIAKTLFNYGFWVQANNFIQMMNYRLSLLFLYKYVGDKAAGYFSAALQLAEAIWIIAKSIATVQYTKISAKLSNESAIQLTLLLSKVSFFISLAASLAFFCIPNEFYIAYLGKEFLGIRTVIVYLLPGILFFSVSLIYCHYYSGLGKFWANTIGSTITFIVIAVGRYFYIPFYELEFAAIINSIGLGTMLVYYVLLLRFESKVNFGRLLPRKKDLKEGIQIIKGIIGE